MRNHVTFTHSSFNTDWEAVDPDNPNCLGEEPAMLIVDGLSSKAGIQVRFSPVMEDWGWATGFCLNDRPFSMASGLYQADDTECWLVFVKSEMSFYKRWFGVRDAHEEKELCRSIHAVLTAVPEVSNIRWHEKADFMRGNEDDWTNTPDG